MFSTTEELIHNVHGNHNEHGFGGYRQFSQRPSLAF
ncbi:MAG: hypothetical protein RL514_1779 [Verrucomicrobiota bacterium]|jgi:hypothetical protein